MEIRFIKSKFLKTEKIMFEKENEIMLEFAKSIAPIFMQEVFDNEKSDAYRGVRLEDAIEDTIHYAKKLTREYFNNQIK